MSKYYNNPVIGVDVAADFSVATILAPDGSIYKKAFKFKHDAKGFLFFLETIKKVEETYDRPSPVFMESTGIYHLNLFYFLISNKVQAFVINPLVTNCNKNKEIRKVKNDKSDSYSIATMGKFENIKTCNMLDVNIFELRMLCREYYDLVDERGNIKKQLASVLRLSFPGYQDIFSDTCGKSSMAILKAYPSPQTILDASPDDLINLLKKESKKGLTWSTNIYKELIDVAQDALKICFLSADATNKYIRLMSLYDFYTLQIDSVESQVYEFIQSDRASVKLKDCVQLLDGIPGIALMSAITLIAEIGDIDSFEKPKQLVAYFGIDPSVNQSGKFNGTKNKMSKRGTKIGRKVLYAVALASVRNKRNGVPNNQVLQKYYQENMIGKPKKVALVAIMHKLLTYIFSVLKKQTEFVIRDPKVHKQMFLENKLLVA